MLFALVFATLFAAPIPSPARNPLIAAPTYTPQPVATRAPSCPPTTPAGIIIPDDDLVPAVVHHTTCTSKAVHLAVADFAPPSPPAPCAHRAFCGPIHLLAKSPAERRAFLLRVGLQIVDGLVTEAGLHQNRLRFPNLLSLAPCPAAATENTCHGPAEQAAISWGRTIGSEQWHLTEADPFVVFAAKNGLGAMLAEGFAFDAATARIEHTWSSSNRTQFDITEAAGHVVGIATWLPVFAAVHHYRAAYEDCAALVANRGELIGPGTGPPTQIVVYTPTYPIGIYSSTAQVSLPACQPFSSIPISEIILRR